jgi:hypothetical protein
MSVRSPPEKSHCRTLRGGGNLEGEELSGVSIISEDREIFRFNLSPKRVDLRYRSELVNHPIYAGERVFEASICRGCFHLLCSP